MLGTDVDIRIESCARCMQRLRRHVSAGWKEDLAADCRTVTVCWPSCLSVDSMKQI